jgi:hypothetical protein
VPSDEQKELWAKEIAQRQAETGETLHEAMSATAGVPPILGPSAARQWQEKVERERLVADMKIAESARDELQRVASQRKADRVAWERGPDSYSAQRDRDLDLTRQESRTLPAGRTVSQGEWATAAQGEWVTPHQQLEDIVQMLTLEGETDNVERFVGVRIFLSPARYAALKRILGHLMPDVYSATLNSDTGNMEVVIQALVE